MATHLTVGILGVQGAFAEHVYSLRHALERLQGGLQGDHRPVTMETVIVRRPSDLDDLDGLVLPGGESTTMSKFLARNNFKETLDLWMKGSPSSPGTDPSPPPVWGTCAGLILLSDSVQDMKEGGQLTIGGLQITADRNQYGRQNESFEATLKLKSDKLANSLDVTTQGLIGSKEYRGIFIRAPGIVSVDSDNVDILAELTKSDGSQSPVAVRQGNLLATAFHPELTEDLRWHAYFLLAVLEHKQRRSKTSVGPQNK